MATVVMRALMALGLLILVGCGDDDGSGTSAPEDCMACVADEDTAECQADCREDRSDCRSDCNDPDDDPEDRAECRDDCDEEFDECRADCLVCDGAAFCEFIEVDGRRTGPFCVDIDGVCVP